MFNMFPIGIGSTGGSQTYIEYIPVDGTIEDTITGTQFSSRIKIDTGFDTQIIGPGTIVSSIVEDEGVTYRIDELPEIETEVLVDSIEYSVDSQEIRHRITDDEIDVLITVVTEIENG